jgi:phage baseplate assembly protein W
MRSLEEILNSVLAGNRIHRQRTDEYGSQLVNAVLKGDTDGINNIVRSATQSVSGRSVEEVEVRDSDGQAGLGSTSPPPAAESNEPSSGE